MHFAETLDPDASETEITQQLTTHEDYFRTSCQPLVTLIIISKSKWSVVPWCCNCNVRDEEETGESDEWLGVQLSKRIPLQTPSSLSHWHTLTLSLKHFQPLALLFCLSCCSISPPRLTLGLQSFISTSRNSTWPVFSCRGNGSVSGDVRLGRRRRRRGVIGGERQRGEGCVEWGGERKEGV